MLYSVLNSKTTIYSDFLKESIYNLLDKTFEIPQSYNFNIFKVTKEYIARPDLISLDAYGDANFADVICKINGISNPFELNEEMKIILPSPEYIMSFLTTPTYEEKDDYEETTTITKTKKSKRKANESILGDTRFKIDKVSKIIIY